MKTLFISDIHLDSKRPDIQDCFNQLINTCIKNAQSIDAVYILGDLFEVWVGDDASIPLYQHTINQLKQLTQKGIKLFIMHGNRDFLLASEFAAATNCTLIPDPYLVTIKSENILLSHGDIFCNDGKDYMEFRQMVRDPAWQKQFLCKTIAERISIAQSMRKASQLKGQQQYQIMDVNKETIDNIMLKYDVQILIHGHTHKPDTHEFRLNNKAAKRIVLPDWSPDAEALIL